MPVWFELIVVMLVAYAWGIAVGWLIWGQSPEAPDARGIMKKDGEAT